MPIARHLGGPDRPHTFVLVHCMPGDSTILEPLAHELATRSRVALVDLPDAGRSADNASLDPDDAVRDLRAVVEHLVPSTVTLVGLSFGAWASARLACTEPPASVTRLVLISGLRQLGPALREAYETMADELEGGRVGLQSVWDGLVAGCFPCGVPLGTRARVETMLAAIGRERAIRTLRRVAACGRDDRRVTSYDLPSLVLHARADAVTSLASGEALTALGRRAQLQIVESDEHLLPLTHVDACAEAILAFHES